MTHLPPKPPELIPTYLVKTNFNGYYKHKKSNVIINGNLDELNTYVSNKLKSVEMTTLRGEVEKLKELVGRLLSDRERNA